LRGEEEQEEGGPFLILFFLSLRCAFLFGGRQDKCFCPPPTAAKIFFLVSIAIKREKLLFVVFLSSGSVGTFDPNKEEKIVFKGLLGKN
jgi:hypothetical protein